MRYCYKNRIRCCRNCFKNVVHKITETKGELVGNKIVEKIVKLKLVPNENSKSVEEIFILP